jgi:hypothetical protein
MGINVFPEPSSSGVNYDGGVIANRPANPAAGTTYYNTTGDAIEIYDGTAWKTITQPSGVPIWNTAAGSLGSATEQTALSGQFTVSATDPEGGAISYSIKDANPAWLSIGSTSGVLSGTTPSVTANTVVSFTIRATDPFGFFAEREFSITVLDAVVAELLIVAGAGGGGGGETNWAGGSGGGGGGGGYYTIANYAITPAVTQTITVGAGGAGGIMAEGDAATNGAKGSNSVFGSLTIPGGGGGGGDGGTTSGRDGGSGGGQSGDGGSPGTAVDGGLYGSNGNTGPGGRAGSGGGAKGGTVVASKNGQTGTANSITESSIVYSSGGGAGGSQNLQGAGTGGTNAGNGGNNGSVGSAGTANRGGGGGGGSGSNGGAGGSGVVACKILSASSSRVTVTGSPTITTAGGYTTYVWTGSGSLVTT